MPLHKKSGLKTGVDCAEHSFNFFNSDTVWEMHTFGNHSPGRPRERWHPESPLKGGIVHAENSHDHN